MDTDEDRASPSSANGSVVPMRWDFDDHADVSYIHFTTIGPGESVHQYVCDASYIPGDIILDFSDDGRLLGIEFLSPSRLLPRALLAQLRAADGADPLKPARGPSDQ